MQVFEASQKPEATPEDPKRAHPAAGASLGHSSSAWYWTGVLTLGLLCRAAPLGPVLLSGEVRLLGTDAWYHVRRIHEAVLHWPQLLAFDPYLNHPTGALNPYEAGLDLLFATLIRGLHFWGMPSFSETAALSAVLMPFLGLLVIPLYVRMATRLGGVSAGRLTGWLLAFLPAVTLPGTLGMVDHHVLEPLALGLPILWTMEALGGYGAARSLVWAGMSLGVGLVFWRGMLLPALLLALFLALRAAWQARFGLIDRLTRDDGPFAFLLGGVVGLPVAMWGLHEEVLTYFTVSLLQPAVFALLALGLYGAGMLATQLATRTALEQARAAGQKAAPARVPPVSAGEPGGRLQALLLALGLCVATFLPLGLAVSLWPTLGDNFLAGLGFLARADRFVQTVGEQRPLFLSDDGQLTLSYALAFYGAIGVLLPLWGARVFVPELRAWRETGLVSARAGRWLLFLLASGVTGCLALMQRRYATHFGPFYAIWLGLGLAQMLSRVRLESEGAGLATSASSSSVWKALTWRALVGAILLVPSLFLTVGLATTPAQDPALMQAMTWLREHTPRTAGFSLPEISAGVRPQYGILAPWDEGHHLVALAQRPNVANPFGIAWFYPGITRAARFWLAPVGSLATAMDLAGARYALLSFRLGLLRDEALFLDEDPDAYALQAEGGYQPGVRFWSLGTVRAFLDEAPAGAPPEFDPQTEAVPGVRLVWEGGRIEPGSPALRWVKPEHAAYKVIERVPGLRLRVQCDPGAVLKAVQEVVTPTGRHFTWQTTAKADAQGQASFLAVYSNAAGEAGGEGLPADWARGTGPLRLSTSLVPLDAEAAADARVLRVWVGEEDILQGRTRDLVQPSPVP